MRKIALALAITTAAVLAVACHNSPQVGGGVYTYDAEDCADSWAHITLRAPSWYSSAHSTTGRLDADPGACTNPHPQPNPQGYIEQLSSYYKYNWGLCWQTSTGWIESADGIYAVQQTWTQPGGCPYSQPSNWPGGYYTHTDSRVRAGNPETWWPGSSNSPVDHFSYG